MDSNCMWGIHDELFFQATDKVKLNNFTVSESGKSILFKEWELLVDEEDEVIIEIVYRV